MADALNELRGMLADDLPIARPSRGPRPAVCAAAVAILGLAVAYVHHQQQQQARMSDDADPLFQLF